VQAQAQQPSSTQATLASLHKEEAQLNLRLLHVRNRIEEATHTGSPGRRDLAVAESVRQSAAPTSAERGDGELSI
jgi:hypothetical protein